MKRLLILTLLAFLEVSCGKKSQQQASSKSEDSSVIKKPSFSDACDSFALDSILGYSLRVRERRITVLRDQKKILSAFASSIEPWSLRAAKELDSVDVGRGFAMLLAVCPPVGDADNCASNYTVDSVREYRNKSNLRYFHIWAESKTTCEDGHVDSSHYQGYFVDVSFGQQYCMIQIPSGLDFSHGHKTPEAIELLIDAIKRK
jgi:hypothetical protein